MTKTKTLERSELTQVIRAASKNDLLAFEKLYDSFAESIYGYFYSRVGNQADADDLTAQTFLTVLEKLPRYLEQGRFKAWLFTIAHNKAMDHFRKAKPNIALETADSFGVSTDMLADVIQSEQIQQLSTLIQGLKEDEQELLRLRYVAELSFPEMAYVLGKRQSAVKKSLYRLQVRLQAQLEQKNE
jgi:RNA polymerase sigma-70 factor (ECF subfamily)